MKTIADDERGQSLLELALTLPLLLLILLGIVDFGRVLVVQQTVLAAARDAARYASIGSSETAIDQVVKSDTAILSDVEWSMTPDPQSSGYPVTVTVTDTINVIDPLLMAFLGSQYAASSSITMRVE